MGTVLIVEDNALNLKMFRDLLAVQGYETLENRDGRDVIAMMREKRPALVIMDIQLPGRSGTDIIREIKADETLKSTPVIAVSAFAMEEDERKIRESGADEYLSKPVSVAEFVNTVRGFLE